MFSRLLPAILRTLAIAVVCLSLAHAAEPKRVALVIGNAAYAGVAALRNPANDATDIAAKLRKLNFDVTLKTNIGLRDMLRTLTEFGDKVQQGSEALFFYAGHGMQVKGRNYLIPIDAEIKTESSVSSEAVDVDQLLDKLSAARLSMVILDACRNNPFERRFRGGGQGLAQINAPTGTLIAYATAPGKVASDGDGRNGLYTQELLEAMDTPGIKVEDVFKRVRANVVKKSGDAQTPWESSSLTGDFYFIFQGPTTVNVQQTPTDPETELWKMAERADTIGALEGYLKEYPKGKFAAAAKLRIATLKKPGKGAIPALTFDPPSGKQDNETQFWNEVRTSGAREYLDAYLKQYPKGKYAALARIEIKKLDERDKQQAQQAEQEVWEQAKRDNTPASYTGYLEKYPQGRHAALASAAQMKAQREAAEQEKLAAARMQREQREAAERGKQMARGPEWAESDNGADINWNEATRYCASKGSGWRLPSTTELQSSFTSGQQTPCGTWGGSQYTCRVSSKSRLTSYGFWSNEPNGSSEAWYVVLLTGQRYATPVEDRSRYRALCVRRP